MPGICRLRGQALEELAKLSTASQRAGDDFSKLCDAFSPEQPIANGLTNGVQARPQIASVPMVRTIRSSRRLLYRLTRIVTIDVSRV